MLRAFLSRFRRDKRGAIAVLIAVAIIPLIAMIGVATDSARGFYARSRLSAAVDAAALAGGQVFFETRRATDAKQFFDANFPPGFMGSKITKWEVKPADGVTPSASDHTFSVHASASIPTIFMRMFGKDTMTVSSYAEVTRESKALDAVLAIDMSGSMNWNISGSYTSVTADKRIELAKAAAKKMVDILYGDNETNDLLRVGIVPWSGAVNVMDNGTSYGYDSYGAQLADADRVWPETISSYTNRHVQTTVNSWNTYKSPNGGTSQTTIWRVHNSDVPFLSEPIFAPASSSPVQTWQGCVWARWEPSNSASDNADMENGLTDKWPGWSPMGPDVQNDSYIKATYNSHSGKWTYTNYCAASLAYGGSGGTCGDCPSAGITRLQNSKTVAKDAISSLSIPSGSFYTDIPNGLAWAWRVLSPEAPYTESSVYQAGYEPSRAIILLTDGDNTTIYGDAYNKGLNGSVSYTMYDGNTYTISERDKRLIDIADAIKSIKKSNGESMYEIYTILFASDTNAAMKRLMKEIATEPNSPYFYNAPSADQLDAAFNAIGNHLSNLRLSK